MQKRECWVLSIFGVLLALASIVKYVLKTQSDTLLKPYSNSQLPEAADKLLKQINGCEFIAERVFTALLIAFLLYLGWKTAYGVFGLRKILPAMLAVLFVPALLAFLAWRQQQGISPTQQWRFALAIGWIAVMLVYRFAWERTQGRMSESVPLCSRLSKREISAFSFLGVLLALAGFVKNAAVARQFAIGAPYNGKAIPEEAALRIMDLDRYFRFAEMAFGILFAALLLYAGWEIAYGRLKWWQVMLVVVAIRIVPALIEFSFQPQDRSVWMFLSQDVFHTAVWVAVIKIYHIIFEKMKIRISMTDSPET